MKRLIAPLALILAAAPALAGYTFEVPRFDFPAPAPTPVLTETVGTQGN